MDGMPKTCNRCHIAYICHVKRKLEELKQDIPSLVPKSGTMIATSVIMSDVFMAFAAQCEFYDETTEDKKEEESLGPFTVNADAARAIAEAIKKTSITIRRFADEDGKITKPVTGWDVHYGFKAEKIDVDPGLVIFKEEITSLGVYAVTIAVPFHNQVEAKIWVVEEERQ